MKTKKYFAMISGNDGPAFGIGKSPDAASRDARKWIPRGESISDLMAVEITEQSFAQIKSGHPDLWERAE